MSLEDWSKVIAIIAGVFTIAEKTKSLFFSTKKKKPERKNRKKRKN